MRQISHKTSAKGRTSRGFGLLELMITLVIAGLLATIAVPSYQHFVERARVARAIGEIGSISVEIDRFRLRNNEALPVTLADLGVEIPLDPWQRPYVYLNIPLSGPGKGSVRKDKNLNPLNTDFDLYSLGKDGDSKLPLTAPQSRDDILRANNGAFIGKGEDY